MHAKFGKKKLVVIIPKFSNLTKIWKVQEKNVIVEKVMNAQWRANVYRMALFTRLQSADMMIRWTLILGCQNPPSKIDTGIISLASRPETQRIQQVYPNIFGNYRIKTLVMTLVGK